MKKYFVFLLVGMLSLSSFADVPTIIAFPTRAWMKSHRYGTFEALPSGREKFNPDYNMAVEDTHFSLTAVLRSVSKPFEEFYHVEDLSQALNSLGDDETEWEEYGADIEMSEQIASVVKPDVILEVEYNEDAASRMGPRARYMVQVSALDGYTNDIIATFNGTTDLSSAPINDLVGNMVKNHLEELKSSMQEKMDETVQLGRLVRVTCLVKDISFNKDQAQGQILKYYVRDVLRGIANQGLSTNKKDTDKIQDYRIRLAPNQKVEDVGEMLTNVFANAGYSVRVDKKGLGKFVVVFDGSGSL